MRRTRSGGTRTIGIAGAGRVAQALGRFLIQRGERVVAIAGRNPERTARAARFIGPAARPTAIQELPDVASHVLIAVSDAAVEPVAAILAQSGFRRGVALHTCGAKGPEALQALASQGVSCGALHPLQSFATAERGLASLPGSVVAIDGESQALQWAFSIVRLLRGRTIRIGPECRVLYHAAAVMASNYVTATICAAAELLQAAGIECSTVLMSLAPIVRASADNSLTLGPVDALTGPIERGDTSTVLAHIERLQHSSNCVRELYCSAGRMVVQMAVQRGLPPSKAAEIQEILRSPQ
jgi:predicted short-subunit dehydrogenase-like oxidoreductase (DUF2520 family)